MTILEMIEKRNQAIEAARNFAAAHKNDNGVLSDEDYALYEQMEKDIQDISREISRMQREDASPLRAGSAARAEIVMNTEKLCSVLCVQTLSMFPMFCVKGLTQTAATLCRKSMINAL